MRTTLKNVMCGMAALLAFGAPQALLAGAWPRERGEVYSKLSLSRFTSDQVYKAKGGGKQPGPDFTDVTASFYGEYGLTESFTGIASQSGKSLRSESTGVTRTEAGAADLWLYGKKGLLKGPVVLSVQAGLKLPMGYDEDAVPPLGDGQIDLEGRLLIGKSLHPFPGYLGAEAGYRKRNGDFSDEIPFALEAGVFPSKSLLFKLLVHGMDNRSNDEASSGRHLKPNVFDKAYAKLMPSVVFFTRKGFGFELYYETFLAGSNTAAGETVGIGLSWQGRPGR